MAKKSKNIFNEHKSYIKAALLRLLQRSKLYVLPKPFYSGLGHILTFHRVCPNDNLDKSVWCRGIEVTPAFLERTINYFLDHSFEVISPNQLAEKLRQKRQARKFVVFTFDDGYADNYVYAYPIFKKYNLPFAIYLTTGFIDRQAVVWWQALSELLFAGDGQETNEAREEAFLEIRSAIIDYHGPGGPEKIAGLFKNRKIDPYAVTDKLMLTWPQVKALTADPLVTIGAHTVNHYVLSRLSESEARDEILRSKLRLERELGHEVKHFTYPNGGRGEVGEREFKLVSESGFMTAMTGRSGNLFPAHADHLECLPRFDMGEGIDTARLDLLTNGVFNCLHNKFRRVVTA